MTSIEDIELGALSEFGQLKKKIERGEWITMDLVWLDQTNPNEEGRQKSDRNGSGSQIGGGEDGRDTVQNIGVEPSCR